MKKTNNIIALKSKKWITDSLLELMEKKDFNKISITEIINNADLTRQTFYRNFSSKEDVLYEYVAKLYEECFNRIKEIPERDMKKVLIAYFEYWYKYKDFLELTNRCSFKYNIMDFYYPFMNEYFEKFIIKLPTDSVVESEYMKRFFFGGLIQIKTYWSETGFKQTPEELAELVLKNIDNQTYSIIN